MTSLVQKMRDIFRLESPLPKSKPSARANLQATSILNPISQESDSLHAQYLDMTKELKELRNFIYDLQAKVIEAAAESGVSINPQALDARKSAIAAQGEDDYEETAAMFFEDVLVSLEMARVWRFKGRAAQWGTLLETANTTRESIKFLREVFKIGLDVTKPDPLEKLIDVEFLLRERVDEIEKNSALEHSTAAGERLSEADAQTLLQRLKEGRTRILSRFKGDPEEKAIEKVFDDIQEKLEVVVSYRYHSKLAPKIFEQRNIESAVREVKTAIGNFHKRGIDDTDFLFKIQETLEERLGILSGKSPSGVGFG